MPTLLPDSLGAGDPLADELPPASKPTKRLVVRLPQENRIDVAPANPRENDLEQLAEPLYKHFHTPILPPRRSEQQRGED